MAAGRIGRVGGVPVEVRPSLAVVVVLLSWELARGRLPDEVPGLAPPAYVVAGLLAALGLVLGVVVHEAGHAVVGRREGLEVDGIALSWVGGVTRLRGEAASPLAEVAVAGIGPLVSATLGGLLVAVAHLLAGTAGPDGTGALTLAVVEWLGVIQLALAAFNLVPAAPLDGGRILHGVVWALCRDRWRAAQVSTGIGVGFGVALVGLGVAVGVGTGLSLDAVVVAALGWWVASAARAEAHAAAATRRLRGLTVADLMRPVGAAPGWIGVDAFLDGYEAARPGWVWMLEAWGGGWAGVVVAPPPGSAGRIGDLATPIASLCGAAPAEPVLDCMGRTGGGAVVLVVEGGHTVGALLPADVEAAATMGGPGSHPPLGVKGFDFGRQLGRSEPWSPDPR